MAPSRTYTENEYGIRCIRVTKEDVLAGYESDDDDVDFYGNRSITNEEAEKLYRQFHESDGFDIDEIPNCFYFGPRRMTDSDISSTMMKRYRSYADIAIQDYNTKQNANLKVLNVVKVNTHLLCGTNYYITFEAIGPSGRSATYQAKIFQPIRMASPKVLLCRPKPSSSSSNP